MKAQIAVFEESTQRISRENCAHQTRFREEKSKTKYTNTRIALYFINMIFKCNISYIFYPNSRIDELIIRANKLEQQVSIYLP